MTLLKLRLLQVGSLLVGAMLIGSVAAGNPALAQRIAQADAKVKNCFLSTACIGGSNSGGGVGMVGISAGNDGIDATTTNPSASQRPASGLYGYDGSTDGGTGNNGIAGYSPNGIGAYGESKHFIGVRGYSETDVGIAAESASTTNYALLVAGTNSRTGLFEAYNSVTGGGCAIDANGNFSCTGSFNAKTIRTQHLTSGRQHVLAYASESTSATIEDVGTARLVGGAANVAIDRAFGSIVDRNDYHVFLTPMGDTRGLYVSRKTPVGFEVREAQGGRSSFEFDYRIVARPLDAKGDRLPLDASKLPPMAPILTKHR